MTVAAEPGLVLRTSDFWELRPLYEPWQASPAPEPRLIVFNDALADELGVPAAAFRTPGGVAVLAGNVVPPGAEPVAQAYAGHQFGGFSPRLGDGRALLLGEVVDVAGRRRDVQLKGSGPTPFARGGDGRAALGPMLREYLMGEAMHALGIPTTRGLAVVATGDQVVRETFLPGAVLTRVAASHLRVGTFQYAAQLGDRELLRRLADQAIARHHPQAADAEQPYLAYLEAVVEVQAALIARWMSVGFIHGVMNTDNMTISGETIDYGPCAFMDAHDPATVFSSIDHGGRYAYGNQPVIAQWDLARFAETLLPLIDERTEPAVEAATEVLRSYTDRYRAHWLAGMRAKLGLDGERAGDGELADDLLELMRAQRVDHTSCFRALARTVRHEEPAARDLFADPAGFDSWADRWRARVAPDAAETMDRVNPIYIPRNHLVEEALTAATGGDIGPFERLLDVLARPFDERPGLERHARPAPDDGGRYRTFCGT